ncbi:MAG TPA: hypothetical protein DEE98_01665 [Elusimicrobia bacterium]|nr:MAG: hypothetical protein A2278_06050 [Elusimicrobia bacterium RIFOXYA12_FULL_49_49]OGS08387.1 MAG: hypothetical protein A2204_08260 [Elusimicrobia bacterium RIFOXYA1_FULL_47_7]OGS10870.1 MAG: hypothetical protein A2386_06100 [Elusimicrobia bacterium RIFOXYB1_FULL_48_9]OGS16646.1 MAG: hypothetical protein A2251_04685 [Elusimicrobia bacterium RIFOXYA2_FULL_47_53]OGS25495.1 MAG: hypothetical protein A2339_00260 [Elusimicrobia bacterium RIFOXYB12_FULL_50_12]OGS31624.1 MAG: hypothetical protein
MLSNPENFFYLEDEASQELSKEERVKGYKVKVCYQPLNRTEKKTKRDMVAQILFGAMKRMKGNVERLTAEVLGREI